MAFVPLSSGLQEASSSHTIPNLGNTAPPPVIVMVPTPAPVRQKIPYNQRFSKKSMLTLSIIQLVMAVLAIITQVVGLSTRRPDTHYAGAGIWCGIFFALSGVFGTIASRKPSFGWIVTYMVFSIISASLCLPLLIISSFGTASFNHYFPGNYLAPAMSAIQVVISLSQAVAAIASAGMTCKAVCKCCAPKTKSGAVYYNGSGVNNTGNAINQHVTGPEHHQAYVTIPMSQIQAVAASAGATALPNISMTPGTDGANASSYSPPPRYESVPNMEEDKEEANGDKYQRFQ